MLTTWKSAWNRGGIPKQLSWVDKDTILWCSGGTHLVFLHLKEKLQTLWRCPSSIDGLTSASSYPQMRLIALSEGCPNPRILILTYPSMKTISECPNGTENSYISTAFAPPDLIISLCSSPDYNLTLWNWRTGLKLFSIATDIHDLQGQVIKVSPGKSGIIAQLGKPSGKLSIWQMIRNSISSLHEQVILPNKSSPVDVDWSPEAADPLLAIIDDFGHVYLCNKNGGDVNRIIFSQRCATCIDYEAPALSWFHDGILLKTTFCQMRFYRKKESVWRREWYVKTVLKPYILVADPFKKEKLVFLDCQGDLMQMTLGIESFPVIEKIFSCGSGFKILEMVQPWGHHLVAVDYFKNVVIMTCDKGEEIARLNLNVEGEIVNMISHFELPIIVISTSAGEICLVTLHDFENPRVLCKYRFGEHSLELLKFSQCGRYLITGRKRYGVFYCIESIEKSSTIRKIETPHKILDILVFPKNEELTILMLILPFKKAKAGNFLTIHKLSRHKSNIGNAVSVIKLPFLYESLHYGLEPMTMISAPVSSLHLHSYKIQDDHIRLTNATQSLHKIRGMKISTNKNWILTYGCDGIVEILKNFKTLELWTSVSSHHRLNFGVSRAILKPPGDLMIVLGSDGSLVGMRMSKNEEKKSESSVAFDDDQIYEKKLKEKISMDYSKLPPEMLQMLSRTYQTIPPEDSKAADWSDWMIKQQEIREEEEFRKPKTSILEDFDKLKSQVSKLLDENEKHAEEERLPISAFDLDMIEREQKIKGAREDRDDRRLELEFQCSEMEKVCNWIKNTFWDVQEVKQQSIFSIFGETEVMNFSSGGQDPQEDQMTGWVGLFDEIGDDSGAAEPKAYTFIRDQYSPIAEDERTILENLFDEEDEVSKKERIAEIEAASGVTTFRFIEHSSEYSQFQHHSFPQLLQLKNSLITDVQALKNYFNKSFNETFALKERAMSSCTQTISHIRFIDSELRSMFQSSVPEIPIEPQWNPKEKPESIITVSDHEVPVKPYVSPSEQVLLDKEAQEQERIRQLMLADDFRRKALIKMMDGVLEYRWEDIIKIDIPQPEFMSTKNPEDYSKEEIIIVQNYEKKVLDLRQERERYKGFLETSYSKTMKTLRETIDKFNSNLQGFLVTRMKVESAIFQLDLLRARWYLSAFHRIKTFKEVEKIKDKISEQESKIVNILSSNKTIEEELLKLKSQRATLHNKEKAVKKFRTEFPSLGKTTLEVLKKHYKRRPKVALKNASPGDVLTLARCIAARNAPESVPLLPEHRHYLTSLEALDVQPEDLPDSVNLDNWENLVKIRRHQIDLEMKLKANLLEIHEVEKNLVENNGKIGKCKEAISNSNDCLREMNKKESERVKDMEIQLVLKMGQVEIDLHGQSDDARNSRLIPVEMIKRMNEGILKAGEDKLKALEEMIKFRRGTLLKEWEHKSLRMKMQELQEEMNEINNLLLTKRMRQVLKAQANESRGFKTVQDLEKEIQAMEQVMQKSLNDWVLKIATVKREIEAKKRENYEFDRKIEEMNVDRWEMELKRNLEAEREAKEINEGTMKVILKRARLCRKICRVYTDLLGLRIERELLRMKRYPVLPGVDVIEINDYDRK